MKKLLALLLALVMVMSLAACAPAADKGGETEPSDTTPTEPSEPANDPVAEVTVMSYEEYMAADVDAKVVIESYVQAHQAWWDDNGQGKVSIYLQDETGYYFSYETKMTEEEAAKLLPGTKVRVTGDKAIWDGEIEILNGTVEFLEGDTYIAEPVDVTELTGEELAAKMNALVTFKGLTFKELSYKDSSWDHDIYVTFTKGDTEFSFCVENTLTGPDTDLYKAVEALQAGDVVDVTGFLFYWFESPNTHITAIAAAA